MGPDFFSGKVKGGNISPIISLGHYLGGHFYDNRVFIGLIPPPRLMDFCIRRGGCDVFSGAFCRFKEGEDFIFYLPPPVFPSGCFDLWGYFQGGRALSCVLPRFRGEDFPPCVIMRAGDTSHGHNVVGNNIQMVLP